MLSILGTLDPRKNETELTFSDGRSVRVPTSLLLRNDVTEPLLSSAPAVDDPLVIPIIEEQLDVTRRTVVTGKVHLEKKVEEVDVSLEETLAVRQFDVERIPVGQVVETMPAVRQAGSKTIYPVVEERLVLTKELVLVEELHVTERASERRDAQTVTLKREVMEVRRESL